MRSSPCPRCRENGKDRTGDNLKRFPDGGQFCFACGYCIASTRYTPRAIQDQPHPFVTGSMPLALMDDLRQFLDDKEIGTHFIYDSGQQRAVLRELRHQFYWGRNKMKSPKVLTKGELPFWVFGSTLRPQSNLLIVVEDPISAIAVSRIYDCIPMWGSQFRPEWYAKIKRLGYQDLGFWFDHDKAEEGLKAALSLKGLFNTGWIDTKLDPKYYTEELVSEYVEQAFKKEVVC